MSTAPPLAPSANSITARTNGDPVSIADWAAVGSAAVAAASAVGSYVKWRQTKSVTAVATAQADRSVAAAERLADATERVAASAESPAVAVAEASTPRPAAEQMRRGRSFRSRKRPRPAA